MSLIKCPECGGMLSDKAAACPSCGAPTNSMEVPRCKACNSVVSPGAKFCPACGSRIGAELADDMESGSPAKGKLYPYLIVAAILLIIIIVASVVIKKIDRPVDAASLSNDSGEAALVDEEGRPIKTAQEKKFDLLYTEKSSPRKYLKHEYTSKNNLLGETIINGSLSSIATLATYRDSKLQVTFFNKKGEELGVQEVLLPDTIAPGRTVEYREKVSGPKGSREAEVVLLSARAVNP